MMNKIIGFVLKNKFAVWLMTIIVIIAGLYSGFNMKMETIPNITTPIVTVTTVYPGATPSEVADKVSVPIEQKIKNLSGVKVVSSSSFQNASNVQIEYNYSKKMDEALQEVKDAIGKIDFPDTVQDPDISRVSLSAFPIMTLSVTNKEQSLTQLTKEVEDKLGPAYEGIEGVSTIQISGQQLQEGQIIFNQTKLKKLGLQEDSVKQIIQASDVRVPLGLFTFNDTDKSVVVDGKATTIDELKNLEIPVVPISSMTGSSQGQPSNQSQSNGDMRSNQTSSSAPTLASGENLQQGKSMKLPIVKLSEIADIKIVGKAESISRTNGQESIGIQIIKSDDANTVDVVNNVKEEVKKQEKEIKGLDIISTFDQGKPIEDSVKTMINKAVFGAIFAMVIIMLFLRDIRSTLISVISIPLSLLIAILLLKQMDITLNIMTLGAMTVAIGRVIDDSIVVVENIYRRMSSKNELLKGKELIREATKEMFKPIASSTIVTIAVFLPLGFVQGMIGELFLPFALTIVFSLLASLLVAVTIVPMMAHSFFKKGMKEKKQMHADQPSKLAQFYKKALNWSLNHKWITTGVAILMLVGSLFLVPIIGTSFLPADEQKMVIASYSPEPGQTLKDVEKEATKAEKYFLDRKNVDTVQFSVGGGNPFSPGSSNQGLFFVEYDKDTPNFDKETEKVISDLQEQSSQGKWASQDFSSSGSSNKVSMYLYGDSIKDLTPVVKQIEGEMKKIDELKNVKSSLTDSYDEYTLEANQKKLSEYGLTAGQVGLALSPQRERPVLTTIEKNGEEVKMYLAVDEKTYHSIDDLTDKMIHAPSGIDVPIKDLVNIKEGKTSDTVTRRAGRIYVEVSGELKTDDASKPSEELKTRVDKLDIPSNIDVSTGGVSQDINESFSQLGIAMLAAVAIVYLILVITFGGGLAPLAILFSLPFTIIGGLVGLLIAGETLSISAMIGALMLIGIVVTNAIVLIDRVIHKEEEGLSTRDALLEAGVTRLRPILMTAIATIGALIPLALGFEGGGLISKGLGVTVIGGLTSSTLLTLVLVPIAYESLMKIKNKFRRNK
jgi:HAE1 family hydrophobic/amphiphilic exporter-1